MGSHLQYLRHPLKKGDRVAYDNCGVEKKQPHVTIKSGNYTYPEKDISYDAVPKKSPLRTVIYGDRQVGLVYGGLKPTACYILKLRFLSDHDNRVQRLRVNDTVLLDKIILPQGEPVEKEIVLPKNLYASGKLQVSIETVEGINCVLSEAELFSDTQGLNPQMEMEYALMPGPTVEDRVLDLNLGQPIVGALITAGSAKATSDATGAFSIQVKASTADLKISAMKGDLSTTGIVKASDFDVFNIPRLSPRPANRELISLNGTWDFLESVPSGFPQNTSQLTKKIEVPGEWVMQGYEVKKTDPPPSIASSPYRHP